MGIICVEERKQKCNNQFFESLEMGSKTPKRKLGKNLEQIHAQHRALSKIDHPNIVKFYETFEDDTHFYSVMELLTGPELVDYNDTRRALPELEVADIMVKALSAINCLHSNGIVHRDIKPQNFHYVTKDDDAEIKLVDFGFAKLAQKDETLHTKKGTPFYIAPEVIKGSYDHRCDYWSLGIMMHELLVGKFPFGGDTTPVVLRKILKSKLKLEGNEWMTISSDAKDLLERLLTKDPKHRITAAEALNHTWIKMGQNPELIEKYKQKKRKELIEQLVITSPPSEFEDDRSVLTSQEVEEDDAEQPRCTYDISNYREDGRDFTAKDNNSVSSVSGCSEYLQSPILKSMSGNLITNNFLDCPSDFALISKVEKVKVDAP
eukprot:CAMPEP_0176433598 /NCGR_PEP_ID=MMETSP0127-20121128/16129_1 /TAXON_ID=938130 /ORGANISM="Platyophrya macrostoma, Strain WH" /LENGTH=376 /DNA_ID=CAMNT_0017816079 /DNA_START=18 /DNA_END=1145 /DNA_ORIENTATION=+